MSTAQQIVTKSEAAAILGVSRPCFSQYLAEGKVDGRAVIGSGHRARIDITVAREQLRKRLEPVRFLGGQGKAKVIGNAASAVPSANDDDADPINRRCIEDDIKAERLRQLALGNEKLQDDAERTGVYVLAVDMRQELGIIATRVLTEVEAFQVEVANAIAARGAVVPADILKVLRSVWRDVRARSAKAFRKEAVALREADHGDPGQC